MTPPLSYHECCAPFVPRLRPAPFAIVVVRNTAQAWLVYVCCKAAMPRHQGPPATLVQLCCGLWEPEPRQLQGDAFTVQSPAVASRLERSDSHSSGLGRGPQRAAGRVLQPFGKLASACNQKEERHTKERTQFQCCEARMSLTWTGISSMGRSANPSSTRNASACPATTKLMARRCAPPAGAGGQAEGHGNQQWCR